MTNETPAQDLRSALEPFQREERYIVIKRKHLTDGHEAFIRGYLDQIGAPSVECVVVESDWPECEAVWRMIEARHASALTQPAENAKGGEAVAWMYERTMGDGMVPLRIVQAHKWTDYDRAVYSETALGKLVHPPAAEPVGLREAVERFIADIDDGDRAEAGLNPLMEAHIADFRKALATPARTADAGVGGEGDVRIAIWNAGMKGGMGQDLTQAFIQRAMAEPTMIRVLSALSPASDRGEADPDFRSYVRKAGERLAPHSGDAPGTPTRDALVWINAALHPQARASVPLDAPIAPNIPAALKPADATPARAEKMRRTLEFIRDTDASAKFLRDAAKTTLDALQQGSGQ